MGHATGVLFSPAGIAGLVEVPFVAAWGITAVPFCALGDLGAKLSGHAEIRPV